MSLRFPNINKAIPNEQEELYIIGYDVVKDEIDRLTNIGWNADRAGDKEKARLNYKAANIYYYMLFLALNIRKRLQMLNVLDKKCNALTVEEEFKLECVENNFLCLGKEYDVSYKKYWEKLLNEFGIDRQTQNCEDCCYGLSEMEINSDGCSSFIIGECE